MDWGGIGTGMYEFGYGWFWNKWVWVWMVWVWMDIVIDVLGMSE